MASILSIGSITLFEWVFFVGSNSKFLLGIHLKISLYYMYAYIALINVLIYYDIVYTVFFY